MHLTTSVPVSSGFYLLDKIIELCFDVFFTHFGTAVWKKMCPKFQQCPLSQLVAAEKVVGRLGFSFTVAISYDWSVF